MKFEGKVVLITGAALGIGRATAMKFAQEGAKLILLDMQYEKLESVKKELTEWTDDVLIYNCDVSNETQVNEVVTESAKKFGKIDILVNNAAIWKGSEGFLEASIDRWKKYIDINIMGVVYMTRAVLPFMIEQQWGRIINVASVAGVFGNGGMTFYSATKGAVISFTKALAHEVAKDGITVNAISPGSVSSSDNPDPNSYEKSSLCFVGRTGTNMENAGLICYLAGDDAGYISGDNILIDGCRKNLF